MLPLVLSEFNEEMHLLIDDFEDFCSENQLLSSDEYTMLVPPCRQSLQVNVENKLYYCPERRINRNPKYLGVYADKSVRRIGIISKRAKVTIHFDRQIHSETKLTADEEVRILRAYDEALTRGWDLQIGSEFFLCDEMIDTDYKKESSGGIQGFQYHDLRTVLNVSQLPNLETIATDLKTATWKGI